MDAYIDTLLTFVRPHQSSLSSLFISIPQAGLFSAALTAFLVQVYTELKPDNTQLAVPILLDISRQLNAISMGKVAPVTDVTLLSVDPPDSLVLTTSLWFVSLVLALGAALFGILVKQWLREYMRWTEIFPLQHAIHIREYRSRSLEDWHIEGIITIMTESLEAGLVLFFVGLAVLLWRINIPTAQVTSIFVGMVLLAAIVVTSLPAFMSSCSYRTSFALLLHNATVLLLLFLVIAFCIVLIITQILLIPVEICFMSDENDKSDDNLIFLSLWDRPLDSIMDSPLVEIFYSWKDFDETVRLPSDIDTVIADRCTSLFWLTGHCTIPNTLVRQCLSDLSGTSVASQDSYSNRIAEDSEERQKFRFQVYCQALLSGICLDQELKKNIRGTHSLEDLLAIMFPDQTVESPNTHSSYAYDRVSIDSLSQAIIAADARSHHALSAYFFSQSNMLSGSISLAKGEGPVPIMTLLRILLLFWDRSEDSAQKSRKCNVQSIDNTNTKMDSAVQSFYFLEKLVIEHLAGSSQTTTESSEAYHIYDILIYGSFFRALDDSRFNGK
jgi:hypothetical protein